MLLGAAVKGADAIVAMNSAGKLARAEGVALNQLINVAVAEKLSALRTERYFAERARRASAPKALKILKRAGASKPPIFTAYVAAKALAVVR